LNGESKTDKNRQTKLVFLQFGAGSIAKEEDEKGWDEQMHE
jgi:hypothetical protein